VHEEVQHAHKYHWRKPTCMKSYTMQHKKSLEEACVHEEIQHVTQRSLEEAHRHEEVQQVEQKEIEECVCA
jgi:hypothetical protein